MTGTRYRHYPEYKDSGIEWLGQIPAHWEIRRLRHSATLNPSKREIASVPRDSEVAFLPMTKVSETGELTLDETKEIGEVFEGYTYFRDNDVLLAKITPCFENGKAAVANNLAGRCGFGSTEFHVLRPHKGKDSRFLYYVVFSEPFRRIGTTHMIGAAGQQRVPEQFVLDWAQPFPDLAEQQAIADFLDRETAKIDALVEKKERLIELLQEKRTALITHAVTKGLDPNVPMKNSGIEWLGQIPTHWDVGPLRRAVSFLTDYEANGSFASVKENVAVDTGSPFAWYVRATDLENCRHGLVEGNRFCDEASYRFLSKTQLHGGELLVTKRGEIGKAYLMPKLDMPATLGPNLYLIRLTEALSSRFAHLWLTASFGRAQLVLADKSTTIGALYKDDAKALLIPFPPRYEQDRIVKYLARQTAKIAALIAKVREAIERLKEYRTALISAGVTGKIDVRGFVEDRDAGTE